MRHVVMAIYDSKAKLYSPQLLVFPAVGVGVRSFTQAVNSKDSDYNKFPEDYSLFKMGEYDDVSGELVKEVPLPQLVVAAVNVLRGEPVTPQLPLALEK